MYQKLTTTSSISHTTRYGNKLSRTRKAGADDEDDELQSRNRHGSLGPRRRLCQPSKSCSPFQGDKVVKILKVVLLLFIFRILHASANVVVFWFLFAVVVVVVVRVIAF